MTYKEAVEYILKHASPYGLEHECLTTFLADVEAWYGRADGGEKANYSAWAEATLYEWDV